MNLEIPDDGYLYVYMSNETGGKAVSFDNLRINHVPGYVMEENHYYPYGLLIEQLSYGGRRAPGNKYKYQDKELQQDLAMNMLDFGARQYDAVLGRWIVQDPMNQFASPYLAMGDNPISNTDPDGRYIAPIETGSGGGAPTGDGFGWTSLVNMYTGAPTSGPGSLGYSSFGLGGGFSNPGFNSATWNLITACWNATPNNSSMTFTSNGSGQFGYHPQATCMGINTSSCTSTWLNPVNGATTTADIETTVLAMWTPIEVGNVSGWQVPDWVESSLEGGGLLTDLAGASATYTAAEPMKYAQRGINLAKESQQLAKFGEIVGHAGTGLVILTAGLQFATGNDNTSTWVDIGVAGAEITAAAILGVAFAPEIAVAGLLYGIISVGGGSDWIDNHFGYRKKE